MIFNVGSGGGSVDAEKVKYDNTYSEYESENVQDAIDELANYLYETHMAFQDGCDTLVAGCAAYGSTPASNAPADIVNSIETIYNNRYTQGYDQGYNQGYNEGKAAGVNSKLLSNTDNLFAGSSSGSTSTTAFSWTNDMGAGYVFLYAVVGNHSSAYCNTTIVVNGITVYSSSNGTYIGRSIALPLGASVVVSCQARTKVTEFFAFFVKS